MPDRGFSLARFSWVPAPRSFASDLLHRAELLRAKGGGEEPVAERRFLRCHAAGGGPQRPSVRQLVQVRGGHLQHGVGETELEDLARHRLEGARVADVDLLPGLLAPRVGEQFEPLGNKAGKKISRLDSKPPSDQMTR